MSLSGVRFPVTNVLGTLAKATPPPVGPQKTPPNTLEYLQTGAPGGGGTVGNTAAEAQQNSLVADYKVACPVTMTEAGDVTRISLYLDGLGQAACNVKCALYTDTAGAPTTRLGITQVVAIAAGQAAGWVHFDFSVAVAVSAGPLWLAYLGSGVIGHQYYAATGGGGDAYNSNPYASDFSDPFGAPEAYETGKKVSIYATYTTVGAATSYPATGTVGSTTALSGSATVKRKATGATAGAVATGLSGSATKKCPQTGVVGIVTGASAAAFAKHLATALASVVTGLSGTAFRRYAATCTVNATSGSSATPTTKRAATGSSAVASGLNGTATARHLVTGLAGAVVTGTSGAVVVKRLAGTAAPSNVFTGISGAATVTEAPTGNYSTGQSDAVTGLSGTANVTRAATGSVSSSTGIAGAGLAKFGVTGSVSSATGLSGSATILVAGTYPVTDSGPNGTATHGLASTGRTRGINSTATQGIASTGRTRGIAANGAINRGLTSAGRRREGR